MFRNNIKTHFAISLSIAMAIGMPCFCIAQVNQAPMVDTPTQRWLPAPRSFPTQQENQAKLLSLLRNSLLQGNASQGSDEPRMSDADVQSLKEAMKQFESYFPEGLTANSLDAIPPELISKALSNPELRKQAKEIAEKHSKGKTPKKDNEDQKPKVNGTNRESKTEEMTTPEADSKRNDFADLMDKLRSTQQNYEQNQISGNKSTSPSTESPSKETSRKIETARTDSAVPDKPSLPPADSKLPLRSRPESSSPQQPVPSRQPRQPLANPNSQLPISPNSNNGQSANPRRNGEPNQKPNLSNPRPADLSRPSNQRSNPIDGQRPENSLPPPSSDGTGPQEGTSKNPLENATQKQATDAREAAKTGEAKSRKQSNSALDIRSELDRRGFGPTMQKIVDEAQRASKAARPKATPAPQSELTASDPTKEGSKEKKEVASATAPAKMPSASPSKQTELNPRSQRSDSTVSKGMQKTGEYLNKLWTDATKNSNASTRSTASRSPTSSNSTPFSRPEVPSIPNPFSAQFLQYILVLAVACLVAFFVLKIKFKQERMRKNALAAPTAPEIDAIQTRDDVVRAFHAIARQRLKSVQAWWTCGHVSERFQEELPEHTQTIRTLSGLYEQARYYPAEHRLTEDQIHSAKLALKQCEG